MKLSYKFVPRDRGNIVDIYDNRIGTNSGTYIASVCGDHATLFVRLLCQHAAEYNARQALQAIDAD